MNTNKFENETVEQDVKDFTENVVKDASYTPNHKAFKSYAEWRYSNPTGTYADWIEYKNS